MRLSWRLVFISVVFAFLGILLTESGDMLWHQVICDFPPPKNYTYPLCTKELRSLLDSHVENGVVVITFSNLGYFKAFTIVRRTM
jgi:hypothetical protein